MNLPTEQQPVLRLALTGGPGAGAAARARDAFRDAIGRSASDRRGAMQANRRLAICARATRAGTVVWLGALNERSTRRLRREFGRSVAFVPEAATLLFSGGFPRFDNAAARCAQQHAIYHTQLALEDAIAASFPGRVLLCDRGTIDGAVYWPHGVLFVVC